MPRFHYLVVIAGLVSTSLTTACDRPEPSLTIDSTELVVPAAVDSVELEVPMEFSSWDRSAGQVFAVRGAQPTDASVVYPTYTDSTLPDTVRFSGAGVRNATMEAFDRSGLVGKLHLSKTTAEEWIAPSCIDWPSASVEPVGGSAIPSWTVAFLEGRVRPVPLDSIETLSRSDSARIAAEATRLASALPRDTALAFRGIPFSVRSVYRFHSAAGVDGLLADVIRRVNQEANPLEEHILLVAERDSAAGQRDVATRYRTVYFERTSGTEETVETTEILAAITLRSPPRTGLVLGRVGQESGAYSLLERSRDGRWRVRWTSVHTGC
ncbi:MAG: hypothetical protein ABR543_13370 [Gemmatimonadaceae bacterium]